MRQSKRIYCVTCKNIIKDGKLWNALPTLSTSGYAAYQCAKCWKKFLKKN